MLGRLQGFDASEDARKAARRAANWAVCAALSGELPLSVAFSRSGPGLVADAAVKVAVLSALRGLLVEAE